MNVRGSTFVLIDDAHLVRPCVERLKNETERRLVLFGRLGFFDELERQQGLMRATKFTLKKNCARKSGRGGRHGTESPAPTTQVNLRLDTIPTRALNLLLWLDISATALNLAP